MTRNMRRSLPTLGLIIVVLLTFAGCVRIEHRPDGTWLYERAYPFGQPSFKADVTSNTLHVELNPNPERTADIIKATADAVLGAAKAAKP